MILNICIVQMEIQDGNKKYNLNQVLTILKNLAEQEIPLDVVLFPELFTTGFDLHNVDSLAEKIPGETTSEISKIASGKFAVIGSILECENDKYFNTAFVLGKNGSLIGKYQKVHLFSPMQEKKYLTPGNSVSVFTLPEFNLQIGLAICYDLRFPELFRTLALKGAQIVFLPADFQSPKRKAWKTLIRARAIENQMFIVAANRVGKSKYDTFFGCSIVTNGEYLEYMTDIFEIRSFSVDLSTLDSIRQKIPVFQDRRTDVYDNKS